jgi:3-deoxy-7-phosphoheptulonate synthase
LLSPAILLEELPLSEQAERRVRSGRAHTKGVIHGEDSRLIAVVGPCSIHDPEAGLEYSARLAKIAHELEDDLLIIMRVYFEKPRTTVGWKGLINDPYLDGTFQINEGLRRARQFLIDVTDLGLPCGSEFLDPISPQFIADVVSWGAIGARTTESQVHRELASGLSMPIGFKNGTYGTVQIAIDAVQSAAHSHRFLGVTDQGLAAIVQTTGNEDCHVILRGGTSGPNYDADAIQKARAALEKGSLRASMMIDCSHGNSRKDHRRQIEVGQNIAAQVAAGEHGIFGVMLESNLNEGRQDIGADPAKLTYGQSVTDACMSWEMTEPLLHDLAKAAKARRTTS